MNRTAERVGLLAEADVFLVLAGLLSALDEGSVHALLDLASQHDDPFHRFGAADPDGQAAALRRLANAARALDWPALVEEHARLHDGATACPINETAYVRRDKGQILADIGGFYRAFGLLPDATRGEKVDHLATQLEFLGLMLVLEAQAIDQDKPVERETTHAALRSFAADHTGVYLDSYCATLAATAATAFHLELAAVLQRVWADFCARRGIERQDALPAAALQGDELGFDCGGCSGSSAP